jgi:hypothetical protein
VHLNDSSTIKRSRGTHHKSIWICSDRRKAQDEQNGWMSYFNRALVSSADYLPGQISEVMRQWRSFAQAKLPTMAQGHMVAMITHECEMYILVASSDGYVYVYSLDMANGGDCALIKQHRLDQLQYEPSAAGTSYIPGFYMRPFFT